MTAGLGCVPIHCKHAQLTNKRLHKCDLFSVFLLKYSLFIFTWVSEYSRGSMQFYREEYLYAWQVETLSQTLKNNNTNIVIFKHISTSTRCTVYFLISANTCFFYLQFVEYMFIVGCSATRFFLQVCDAINIFECFFFFISKLTEEIAVKKFCFTGKLKFKHDPGRTINN